MSKHNESSRRLWIATAICCGTLAAGAVLAQSLNEIVVTAQRMAKKDIVGRSPTSGAPVELVTVTHRVDYADLDLVKHADVLTLEQRVHNAARDGCRQLDKLYPISAPQSDTCTKKAVADARPQIERAISHATSSGIAR